MNYKRALGLATALLLAAGSARAHVTLAPAQAAPGSRYEAALRSGDDVQAFAGALAQGGYATDPQYAQKLVRISRQIPQ